MLVLSHHKTLKFTKELFVSLQRILHTRLKCKVKYDNHQFCKTKHGQYLVVCFCKG